jgi:hypothetical protein
MVKAKQSCADLAVQGERLLWSTSDAALRVAIMETISHCSAPLAEADITSSEQQQSGEEQERMLLLGKREAELGGGNEGEDWT